MRTSRRIGVLANTLAVMNTGCGAGWRNVPVSNQGSFAPRQQAQVWIHDRRMVRVQQVRWTTDSIFGQPYLAGLDGDTVGVMAIPRSDVDSIRTGNPAAGFWKTTGVVIGGLVVATVLACRAYGCPSGD